MTRLLRGETIIIDSILAALFSQGDVSSRNASGPSLSDFRQQATLFVVLFRKVAACSVLIFLLLSLDEAGRDYSDLVRLNLLHLDLFVRKGLQR